MGQQGICEIFHKVGSGLPTKRFAATFPPMKHTILAFLALGVGLANAADENKKAVDLKAGDFTFKVAAPWKKEKPSSRMVAGKSVSSLLLLLVLSTSAKGQCRGEEPSGPL